MKRRPVVEAGARLLDELLDVFRCFVGKELDSDDAHFGGDDNFELGSFFEGDLSLRWLGVSLLLLADTQSIQQKDQNAGRDWLSIFLHAFQAHHRLGPEPRLVCHSVSTSIVSRS